MAKGAPPEALAEAKKVKIETILRWVQRAAEHAQAMEDVLIHNFCVSRVELDELWSYVKNKGEKGGDLRQRAAALSGAGELYMPSRLRIARSIGKREEEVAEDLVRQVKNRGVQDEQGRIPPFASDGLSHYRKALLEIYGEVPPYKGRGRPPTTKLSPEELRYGQIVKHRKGGRVVWVKERVIFGEEEEVRRSLEGRISTSHVERDNGTTRCHNWWLTRKTLGYAKTVEALEAACAWTDIVYNFCHPHKALRVPSGRLERKWEERTPAMAAGVTDHIWSVEEVLTWRHPNCINS